MKEAECYPGKRIGRLTLIERRRVETEHYGKRWEWLCKCDCGEMRRVLTFRLGNGKKSGTVDCGNHTHEKLVKNGKKGVKDITDVADSNPRSPWRRLYIKWHDMIVRCENPKKANYPNYGGRGIKVCPEWHDYETFKQWAIDQGYDYNNHDRGAQTLDRIDVDGNYEPSNCRLTGTYIQSRNKTNNHWIEWNGTTKTLVDWCKYYNLDFATVYHRQQKGLTPDNGLFDKPLPQSERMRHTGITVEYHGEIYSLDELAKIAPVSNITIRNRYKKGLRGEDLVAPANR